mgnify:CR=1 FL=1
MSNYRRFYNPNYKYVFFTIVTYNRIPILIENIELLRSAFKYALTKYNFEIYAINVLKDHMHLILKLDNNKDYSEIIRLVKYYFSSHIKTEVKIPENKIKRREKGVWQRRYWEHTIRNENDLNTHLDYLHYNSYKHYKINPQNWNFSSFNKFVNLGVYEPNWCNFEDINNINSVNYE